VIGRYVPQLEFLGVLLGSDPVLAPEEQLYQRLLAGNLEEAVEIAEDYVDAHSSREFYDNVAIPSLRLAENDRQRSTTDTNYRRLIADTAIRVVREVEDHIREKASTHEVSDEAVAGLAPSRGEAPPPSVLCLAGRTELDRATAEMMAQVLDERGIGTRVLPPIAVSQDALGQLDLNGVQVVCLSYLHPQPQVYARYICRRLRRRAPHLKLVVCCWNPAPGTGQAGDLTRQMGADAVFMSLEACLTQVEAWVSRPTSPVETSPVLADMEQDRIVALQELGLTSAADRRFDEVSRAVAQAFDVPIALVSLADQVRHPRGERVDAGLHPGAGEQPAHEPLEAHVVATGEVLVAEDVTVDERFADDPLVLEKGIRFYAGAPLRTSAGVVIGALCIIDTKPREFLEPDQRRLQDMANELMADLEQRALAGAGQTQMR
jgi:GAF domain-containing protein